MAKKKKKKKRRGHYCWGCDSHKSNESFSGRGHRNHLCKKCKSQGITKRPKKEEWVFELPKTPPNPYSKKIRLIDSIVVGATVDGYSEDAKDFWFFKLYGAIYVLVEKFVFKYQPNEEQKYVYMDGLYEPELGESIFNKGGLYPDWMAYGWEELEEIKRLGIEELKVVMNNIPWDDEFALDQYFQDENSFFPGDFTEGFIEMEEEQQNMFLSLLELKVMVEKLESEREALDDEDDINFDDDYYTTLGVVIDGVFY